MARHPDYRVHPPRRAVHRVIVELIELGSEGALFGLLSTTTHVATPFGRTAAKLINARFHVWRDDIRADTYTTRRDVTITILISYGMKLLSLSFLPLLPSQKAATRELRRYGGASRRRGLCMVGVVNGCEPVEYGSSHQVLGHHWRVQRATPLSRTLSIASSSRNGCGTATPRFSSNLHRVSSCRRVVSISASVSRISSSSDRELSRMLARSTTKLVSALQRPQGVKPLLARSFAHRVGMVLKEDVPKLGFRGDEVSVKAGYARNFLYPEKLAVYATPANRETYKVDKESVDETLLEKEHELEAIIYRLSNIEVSFKRHTAAKTEVKLHSEVNAQNISDMLEKQHGLIVGVARIDLPAPIKTLGEHTVKVRVDDAIEEEYAAGAVVSAAEGEAEAETVTEAAEGDDKKLKKGPSKKKWVSLAIEVERR
ncbi:hypothetical protein PHYPSEUDO_006160 [Phytophthora pseudosyringae]|uniref:50S ribosomal protein L9, chloroplastic n=1 Tax=Phytophthora pseudosyringae TaxID=221518 RepID=A0A8T1WCR9_9STRA|nr:hypothetical protein PHYPSEUDO_006160 [Phytophthora pseudosyringae]